MRDTLMEEAARRARRGGLEGADLAVVAELIQSRRGDKTHVVEFERQPGGTFYRPAIEGGKRILYINIEHPFWLSIYHMPGTGKGYRDGLETMLWALALCEIVGDEEKSKLYAAERVRWSRHLAGACEALEEILDLDAARSEEHDAEERADEPSPIQPGSIVIVPIDMGDPERYGTPLDDHQFVPGWHRVRVETEAQARRAIQAGARVKKGRYAWIPAAET